MFLLAMIQLRVEPGEVEANLRRAETRIAEAARSGAQVLVLPEAMDVGWTHPTAARVARSIPDGETALRLRAAARQWGVWIAAGLTERAGEQVFNGAVLINPGGDVVLHHRKLNELAMAHSTYAVGDRLAVVPTPWGLFGLMICADAFAPGQPVSRALGMMGARVILSPCAWAVPADHNPAREPYGALWRDSYGLVAREFGLWIAGVSNVGPITAGPWAGRRCIGSSLLVGPDGEPRVSGPCGVDAETVLYFPVTTTEFMRGAGLAPGESVGSERTRVAAPP